MVCKIKPRRLAAGLALLALYEFNAVQAQAQDATWQGATNGDYGTGSNWSGNGGAVPTGVVTFDNTTSVHSVTIDSTTTPPSPATFLIASNAPSYSFTFNNLAFGTFTPGALVNNSVAQQSFSLVNSTLNWNLTSGILASSSFTIDSNSALILSSPATAGGFTSSGLAINNSGALLIGDSTGTGTVTNNGGISGWINQITTLNPGLRFNNINGGSMDLTFFGFSSQTVGSIDGDATSSIFLGSFTLTAGSPDALVHKFAGVIQDGGSLGGTGGSLVKGGTDTLILSGDNTYTGGTTVGGGTLQLGDGGTSGSVLGSINVATGANLAVNRSDTFTLSNLISGGGAFQQNGTGTTILTNDNTYTGGTTISAGTLRLGNGGTSGSVLGSINVASGANLAVNRSDTFTLSSLISGGGAFQQIGTGTTILTGGNTYTGGTTINAGTLQLGTLATTASIVGAVTSNAGQFDIVNADTSGITSILINGGAVNFRNASSAGTATVTNNSTLNFFNTSTAANANITNGSLLLFQNSSTAGNATITNNNGMTFQNSSTAGNANITNNSTTQFQDTTTAGGAIIENNGEVDFQASSTAGNATVTTELATQPATTRFQDTSTAGNATFITNFEGTLRFENSSTGGTARFITNAGGTFDLSLLSSGGMTAGSIEGAGSYLLGSSQLTTGSNNLSTTVSGVIADGGLFGGTGGSLVKVGTGTLTLSNDNTYTGGTTISGGTLQLGNGGTSGAVLGNILDNGTLAINRSDAVTLGNTISGTGGFQQIGTGTTTMTATNSYTGPTQVVAGSLIVNGSTTSNTTVGVAGTLGGGGSISGNVLVNGTAAPGGLNTLTVNGTYSQAAGSFYQVAVNVAGQNSLINVRPPVGPILLGPNATILGGTVNVLAAPGSYGAATRYTILTARNGVAGTFSGVTISQPSLRASLSYDANDVFLTLLSGIGGPGAGADPPPGGFVSFALTPNQRNVAVALDRSAANATGDMATILNTLGVLSPSEGARALDRLGPEPHSGFASDNILASRLFMNEVGHQIAAGRGAGGNRAALAEACASACEAAIPGGWSTWASALGGTGNVPGDGNAHSFGYTIGGGATGADYRLDEWLLVGLAAGYTNATHYLDGLDGRGNSDGYYAALYTSLSDGALYFDGLAGYARYDDRMKRTISFSGLTPRTAQGQTHADQFLGQFEMGYRIAPGDRANASLTPFGRLQGTSTSQAAFTESGAGDINLTVATMTTNSLRSILGAELAGEIGLGWSRPLALQLRVGWAHDLVQDGRAVTAAFAGAPALPFTVVGAVPPSDSAIIGFNASTAISKATSLYVRYDADINSSMANHALTAGLHLTW